MAQSYSAVKGNNAMKEILNRQLTVIAYIIITLVLIVLPTGFEGALDYREAERCKAEVISTDDSRIIDTGLVRSGEQRCRIKISGGKFKGVETDGVNMLSGTLENDKIFRTGDKALVLISYKDNEIISASMIDHYRINLEAALSLAFVILLFAYSGKSGMKAVLSFVMTILIIWKILVPMTLKGFDPVVLSLAITLLLTFIIISLVYGYDKRTLSAVSGGFLGVMVTCVLSAIFTRAFKIHGAVMAYSESLLYSGYSGLDLTEIFMSGIFMGASGAIMDLAVDITSSVYEIVEKKPDISKREAIHSGFTLGRAAMDTVTTTLLLAYSGGYIALLMVFMAQGTPIFNILNYKSVSAEILHTIAGSFGLVSVAPFTAIMSGIVLTKNKSAEKE